MMAFLDALQGSIERDPDSDLLSLGDEVCDYFQPLSHVPRANLFALARALALAAALHWVDYYDQLVQRSDDPDRWGIGLKQAQRLLGLLRSATVGASSVHELRAYAAELEERGQWVGSAGYALFSLARGTADRFAKYDAT